MSQRKFTDEAAVAAIKNTNNYSIKSVLRSLGCSAYSGSNYGVIYRLIEQYKLDTSHWKGKAWRAYIDCPSWVDVQEYLTNKKRINSHALKLRLIREGIKQHQCEQCGIKEWQGKPVPIELHHVDGNKLNNELKNLRVICPNCHAQTDTYCSKNKRTLRGRKRN